MDKKAQDSRNDLLIWYISCFILVVFVIGGLYRFGVIGNVPSRSSLADGNKISGAFIDVSKNEQENNLEINKTDNHSLNSEGK
ncbi:hypothetical protein KY342_00665 [Candidatus Woesearchaeota archaeon]|nr:hypothetical protein [Candidatus Woesearchaeota archaeon]